MTPLHERALVYAQRIKNDDLRASTIMCILANNIAGLRELREYAQGNDDIGYTDWDELCLICDYLVDRP